MADGSALPPVSPRAAEEIEAARKWIAEGKWLSANQGATLLRYIDALRAALRDGPPGEPSYEAKRAAFRALWGQDPEYVSAGDAEGEVICARDEDRWIEIGEMLSAAYAIDGRGTATP